MRPAPLSSASPLVHADLQVILLRDHARLLKDLRECQDSDDFVYLRRICKHPSDYNPYNLEVMCRALCSYMMHRHFLKQGSPAHSPNNPQSSSCKPAAGRDIFLHAGRSI